MEVSDVKRLKALEGENRRLKRLLVDQALDIVMLRETSTQKSGEARRAAKEALVSAGAVSGGPEPRCDSIGRPATISSEVGKINSY